MPSERFRACPLHTRVPRIQPVNGRLNLSAGGRIAGIKTFIDKPVSFPVLDDESLSGPLIRLQQLYRRLTRLAHEIDRLLVRIQGVIIFPQRREQVAFCREAANAFWLALKQAVDFRERPGALRYATSSGDRRLRSSWSAGWWRRSSWTDGAFFLPRLVSWVSRP